MNKQTSTVTDWNPKYRGPGVAEWGGFLRCWVVLATLAVLLLGCAGEQTLPINVDEIQGSTFSSKPEPLAEPALGPADSFSFVLYTHSGTQPLINLNSVQLDAKGEVMLPVLGKVTVAGLNASEIEARLHELYNREYVDPRVQVAQVESRNSNVYVLGEVKKPGIFQLKTSVSVLELILMAQGFTADADRARIVLVRPAAQGNPAGRDSVASTDIARLLEEAKLTQNVQVRPGDVIYVPPDNIAQRDRFFRHVINVMKPFTGALESIATIFVVSGAANN